MEAKDEIHTVDLRVFLSYRRDDCQPQANGLADGLRSRLAGARVFMDIDNIPIGADFVEHIREEIRHCDVVLVLIGDDWLETTDDRGRRLEDQADFVRLEIESALQDTGVTVVPVLVEGARMPPANRLPSSMHPLARLHAFTLADDRWSSDLDRLARELRDLRRRKGTTGSANTMRHADVDDAAVRAAVEQLAESFQTKDVSEHPVVQRAHAQLSQARNYHATIGSWLSRHSDELTLRAQGKGGDGRGETWRRLARTGHAPAPTAPGPHVAGAPMSVGSTPPPRPHEAPPATLFAQRPPQPPTAPDAHGLPPLLSADARPPTGRTDQATDLDTDALPSTSNAALSDLQWTPERLTTFAASEVVSVQRFVAALDVLAVDPSRTYGTAELAEAAGLAYSAFKHATTRMSSHLAKHYDIEAWPMTATWNDVREEVDWSITVTVAARWREIRGL